MELTTYESLTFTEIRVSFANIPNRLRNPLGRFNGKPVPDYGSRMEEQFENETKIIEPDASEQIWKEPTLFNLTFLWLMNNENICNRKPDEPEDIRLMPIIVHTARSHFEERLALRRTWGAIPIYKKWVLRFVFLLGEADLGTNPEMNQDRLQEQEKKLQEEQNKYGDLVIGSFIDSYHNLTYKHMMGYKWILNFCRHATFVLKIDDDMFIDIMRWLDWRTADLEKVAENPNAVIPEYFCHTFGGTGPIREKGSKWYASVEDWPDEHYPDYCSGWAYASIVSLLGKLYSVHRDIKFFWVDDVFATGALMEVVKKKYNYKPEVRHIWGEVTGDIADYRPLCDSGNFTAERKFKAVVYVPRGELFERDMMCMWNKTLHDSSYKFT